MEYFQRRPFGWRDDNRAAIIAMSMGGSKLKPEDLFDSLRTIKNETAASEASSAAANFAVKFFERFGSKFTEENPFADKV